MSNKEFKSVDHTTGMLTDPGEMHESAVEAADMALQLIANPMLVYQIPPGQLVDVIGSLVMIKAINQPTTQADLYRDFSSRLGRTPQEIERDIVDLRLSEELPFTHEAAAHDVPDISGLKKNPLYEQSYLMQSIVEQAEAQGQKVDLPAEIEQFLKGVTHDDYNADSGSESDL